jgi:hypothetical protein
MKQIHSQLSLLTVQHPTTLQHMAKGSLDVRVTLLFKKEKAKAEITFTFKGQVLVTWRGDFSEIGVDVKVKYGNLK